MKLTSFIADVCDDLTGVTEILGELGLVPANDDAPELNLSLRGGCEPSAVQTPTVNVDPAGWQQKAGVVFGRGVVLVLADALVQVIRIVIG